LAWKLIFTLAIINNWLIYKVNIVSAFTQRPIKNNLYIFQPEGDIDSKSKDSIYKLNKVLYSLKQSAKI